VTPSFAICIHSLPSKRDRDFFLSGNLPLLGNTYLILEASCKLMLPIAKTPQFPGNFTRLPCPPCARGPRLSSARGRCWAHPPGQEIQDYQQQGQQQDAAAPLHLNGATTGDYLSGFGVEGQARTGRGATAAEPDVQSNPSNSRVLGQVNSISLAQQFLAGFEAGQDAAAEAQQQDQQQQRRQEQAMDPPSNSAAQVVLSHCNDSALLRLCFQLS